MIDKHNWKKHLLKSGLPFEYEVKECFVKNGCTVWDEYSYVKTDENNLEKEFSYDLEANYWEVENSFTFMVECKYKTEPTKWFFLPHPYGYQNDVTPTSFFHTIDYFKKDKFIYGYYPYYKVQDPLGPFCLKGVEIFQNQFLETNIFKAINQLSFAFIGQFIQSVQSQLEDETFHETNFFNIPMIITNAELHLINEKLTTAEIEKAKNIEQISKRHDFLLFNNKTGETLRKYNEKALREYFATIDKEIFGKRNKSFAADLSHFIEVVAKYYAPEVILIMHHDHEHKNYQKLFNYINYFLTPSEDLKKKTAKLKKEWLSKTKKVQNYLPVKK